jgi:transcriptional regulator GlxA family with amidase domain
VTARPRPLDVAVVLLDDGFASTAIAPVEVFHAAGGLWHWLRGEPQVPRFRVRTASLDGGSVRGLCGLKLQPEFALADIRETDIIIVSASGWDVTEQIARASSLVPWLRDWHARGAYIAGVCTGAAFLAEAGILDGRQATTHWAMAGQLRARYPKVDWQPEQFLTEDNRVFCSGGVYAAVDLSLYLVEKFCGHETALQVARSLLVSMPRSRQAGYAVLPLSRPHEDGRIREVEEFLQANFSREVSIDALAGRIGMSPRTLLRRFKAATGRLPGVYLQMLRVASARELLEQGGAVQGVSAQVGYEDGAFFRRIFKRHTGMTPAEYRSRFARMHYAAWRCNRSVTNGKKSRSVK